MEKDVDELTEKKFDEAMEQKVPCRTCGMMDKFVNMTSGFCDNCFLINSEKNVKENGEIRKTEFKNEMKEIETFFADEIVPIITSYNDNQIEGIQEIMRMIDDKVEKIDNYYLFHRQIGVHERIIEKYMINNGWTPENRARFFHELNEWYV